MVKEERRAVSFKIITSIAYGNIKTDNYAFGKREPAVCILSRSVKKKMQKNPARTF